MTSNSLLPGALETGCAAKARRVARQARTSLSKRLGPRPCALRRWLFLGVAAAVVSSCGTAPAPPGGGGTPAAATSSPPTSPLATAPPTSPPATAAPPTPTAAQVSRATLIAVARRVYYTTSNGRLA